MGITRKLTTVGKSRGISLPKSWIDYTESKAGRKIVKIALEVNSNIVLSPIFEKQQYLTGDFVNE
jgi:hypothetical protein